MKFNRRKFLKLAAGGVASSAVSRIARAQTYPSRAITISVPFAAGGSTDTIGRMIAQHMRTSLGQPVIVENVAGASGTIGVCRAAHAVPDGYTLSIGHLASHVINGAVFALPCDLLNDFAPIAQLVGSAPLLIVARKSMPANDLKEFIGWLKANPDSASQGTSGAGSASHVAGLSLQKETGTRFGFVPYRGAAPAMQDLLAGHIDFYMATAIDVLPHLHNIKTYAVTGHTRLAAASDIPTVDEEGLPQFYVSLWQALWAPKGTPKSIIMRLNQAVVDALADSTVRQRLADLGEEIPPREEQTPEALGALHKAEIEKWWPIIKAANIRAD